MYVIKVEPDHKLMRLTMSGFFSVAEAQSLERDMQNATNDAGYREGGHLLLVDVSECVLQAQEVVAAFQMLLANRPQKARRIAVMTGGALARMQAKRVLERETMRIFDDCGEAEKWLAEPV